MTTTLGPIADDLLRGVDQIAKEVGLTKRQTYHQLENGLLPAGKTGALWVASKAVLRAHFAKLTMGDTEQ